MSWAESKWITDKLQTSFQEKIVIPASGSFTVPVTGWYNILCIGAGANGIKGVDNTTGATGTTLGAAGGGSGGVSKSKVRLTAGTVITCTVSSVVTSFGTHCIANAASGQSGAAAGTGNILAEAGASGTANNNVNAGNGASVALSGLTEFLGTGGQGGGGRSQSGGGGIGGNGIVFENPIMMPTPFLPGSGGGAAGTVGGGGGNCGYRELSNQVLFNPGGQGLYGTALNAFKGGDGGQGNSSTSYQGWGGGGGGGAGGYGAGGGGGGGTGTTGSSASYKCYGGSGGLGGPGIIIVKYCLQ